MSRARAGLRRCSGLAAAARALPLEAQATVAMLAVVGGTSGIMALAWPLDAQAEPWARGVSGGLAALAGVAALIATVRPAVARAVPLATGTLVALASLHWAAHRDATAFEELYVLPALLVGAFGTVRQGLLFFAAVVAAEVLPAVAEHATAGQRATTATDLVVMAGLMTLAHTWGAASRRRAIVLLRDRRQSEREARRDVLTGLPNRRAFEEELDHAVQRAATGDAPVAVVLMDVNGFKRINDEFGHLAGDRCLADVARALRRTLRQGDVACRWGGDEFALLLRGVSGDQARGTAERVNAEVIATCLAPDGQPLSVKWGIATPEGDTGTAAMRRADDALVRATRFRALHPPTMAPPASRSE